VLDEEESEMKVDGGSSGRFAGLGGRWGSAVLLLAAACCAGIIVPVVAASIPAWLDDGISRWNAANADAQIRFVDIKDSFVWYDMPKTAEVGHQKIRERLNAIVLDHGYTPTDDEELITTAKPPVITGKAVAKKCWSRSFVMNIKAQSDTKAVGDESPGQRQRMLTSLVCEDTATWWAAFRVAD
jgi:hypothetical protein